MRNMHNLKIKNVNSIFLSPISELEIVKIANNLKNSNSSGPDNLNTNFVKKNISFLCTPLCIIFNECLEKGIFPNILKKAKVVTIFKKGSRSELNNYRPISLLSVVSKIFEKCLAERLEKHFEKNNLFTSCQYGFRKGRNTSDAVINLVTEVMSNLNKGRHCGGVFCDLTKAFDCVSHEILLNKLEYYGVRGTALNLFESYLTDRTQYVEISCGDNINLCRSDEGIIKYGVPQGSVLGPLLFLIFINDLPVNLTHGTPYLYADDTSIILNANTAHEFCSQIESCWMELESWFTCNGLKMNCGKSFYTIFRRSFRSTDLCCNLPIEKSDCIRFLGIDLDPYLRWHSQIETVCKRLASACYSLKSISKIADSTILKTVYFSYFESIIRYCIEVWGNGSGINSVLLLQKKALRLITGSTRIPITHRDMFKDQKIMTITSVYLYRICVYVYLHRNKYPTSSDCHDFNLRNKNKLARTKSSYGHFNNSFNNMAIKIFNKLNQDIKDCQDFRLFDKKVKDFFINRPYYTINEYFANSLD